MAALPRGYWKNFASLSVTAGSLISAVQRVLAVLSSNLFPYFPLEAKDYKMVSGKGKICPNLV